MDANYKKALKAAKFLRDVLRDLEKDEPKASEYVEAVESTVSFVENYIKDKLFEQWKESE